jgi:hypothetical protein
MAYKFNPFTGKLDISGTSSGGGGTVTSITAGTGLTGGTITTSGTIAVNSSVVLKDANNNISANAFFNNLATITASGTQVVLTAASAPVSLVTGSGGQTIKLPDATTLTKGTIFSFNNNQSSGAILVNNNSNTLIVSIPSGGYVTVVLLDNATAAGSWDRHDQSPANVSWSTNTFDYPGSITSATWNGNTVAYNRGGTGQSSAFVAGGIAYGSSTSVLGVTPIGTTGQVLTSAGAGAPTWTTPSAGSTNIWIPASAWIPRTTTGCGVDSRELATNFTNYDELLFDPATNEFAQALTILPNNYNNSTITGRFYWTSSTGSGSVVWGLQGCAYADGDSLDQAFGTAQTATDTLIATNSMHVTSATSAITIAGTPAANRPILFQIYRDASAGGDTLASDARFLGVEILFN